MASFGVISADTDAVVLAIANEPLVLILSLKINLHASNIFLVICPFRGKALKLFFALF
jgi:hypothetical protein